MIIAVRRDGTASTVLDAPVDNMSLWECLLRNYLRQHPEQLHALDDLSGQAAANINTKGAVQHD